VIYLNYNYIFGHNIVYKQRKKNLYTVQSSLFRSLCFTWPGYTSVGHRSQGRPAFQLFFIAHGRVSQRTDKMALQWHSYKSKLLQGNLARVVFGTTRSGCGQRVAGGHTSNNVLHALLYVMNTETHLTLGGVKITKSIWISMNFLRKNN
jgi:hypothetical protein